MDKIHMIFETSNPFFNSINNSLIVIERPPSSPDYLA
jgi:hypothetical protein